MLLSEPLENEIEIDGEVYSLRLSFDIVLRFFDLMDDDSFFDAEKVAIAFRMFVDTEREFDLETQNKAVMRIVDTFIIGDNDEPGETKKTYDFKQDAEYIYASFMQEYGIDLIEQQGRLRWEKFVALLTGLRDETKFKEVIGIRTCDLPKGKEMKEERERLKKLKRLYALEKDQKQKEQELDMMFDSLAKKG